ncbi:MAG: molybdopterin-synthase adenylyltransferase MoeB [Proteobacteria bacterium]|nr:molybdopterin-synthase adenylyltransferase MoeB [Pseudomonadota bacterium]
MDRQPPRFSDREVERYARHLVLREIGGPGQQKLKAARVLLVGAGGIGAPAALYLAAAGVGTLGLLDDDAVALSNLQRQVLYAEADLGRPKVEAAAERLGGLNSDIAVVPMPARLTPQNARELVAGWDLVIDGSDSFETRAAVGEACVAEGVTLVAAAIGRWEAQIAVLKGKPCWRCFVPEIPPDAETCVAVGVVGALAGVAGSLAALAAIRAIAEAGPDIAGEVMILDALNWRTRIVRLAADPDCTVCG